MSLLQVFTFFYRGFRILKTYLSCSLSLAISSHIKAVTFPVPPSKIVLIFRPRVLIWLLWSENCTIEEKIGVIVLLESQGILCDIARYNSIIPLWKCVPHFRTSGDLLFYFFKLPRPPFCFWWTLFFFLKTFDEHYW